MTIVRGPDHLRWRVHLSAPPEMIFDRLATDRGRESFWAERSEALSGAITLTFPDRSTTVARIMQQQRPRLLELEYFGALTRFELLDRDTGSTVLQVTVHNIAAAELVDVAAGWVSVLLNLKSVVNTGHDLRNHDAARTWADGFVDN